MGKLLPMIQRASERTATKLLKLSMCHEFQEVSCAKYAYSTMTNLGHMIYRVSISLKFLKWNVNVKLDKFPLSELKKFSTNSLKT
jgi:hypothetical protein